MRPHIRHHSPSVVPRILFALPLGLAVFALLLQFSGRPGTADSDVFDLFNEQEFIRRSNKLPRLERQLRTRAAAAAEDQTTTTTSSRQENGLRGEDWQWPSPATEGPKIAFIVTTSESVKQISLWMAYHRAVGVSFFFLFVEGQAGSPAAIAALSKEPGVTVIPNDDALQQRHAKSRIWNESWLSAFFNKPCNHELFVRQSLNMELGIQLAQEVSADWILHVDTDELIYPGGTRDYSLQELLATVPTDVTLLVFPNYESLAERIDVEDPFLDVTLFKRSYSHVQSEVYFQEYSKVARGNPNYFTTYGNGKSAARVIPGLRPNGAHRWHNYFREPKEWTSEQSAVLHYTFNRFSDLKSRRDRCDCKPTQEDAERCFILPFDRLAFLEASLKGDDDLMVFFKERLIWDDSEMVIDFVRKGLFSRLYEPQVMIRGLREAMMRSSGDSGNSSGSTNSSSTSSSSSATSDEKKTVVAALGTTTTNSSSSSSSSSTNSSSSSSSNGPITDGGGESKDTGEVVLMSAMAKRRAAALAVAAALATEKATSPSPSTSTSTSTSTSPSNENVAEVVQVKHRGGGGRSRSSSSSSSRRAKGRATLSTNEA